MRRDPTAFSHQHRPGSRRGFGTRELVAAVLILVIAASIFSVIRGVGMMQTRERPRSGDAFDAPRAETAPARISEEERERREDLAEAAGLEAVGFVEGGSEEGVETQLEAVGRVAREGSPIAGILDGSGPALGDSITAILGPALRGDTDAIAQGLRSLGAVTPEPDPGEENGGEGDQEEPGAALRAILVAVLEDAEIDPSAMVIRRAFANGLPIPNQRVPGQTDVRVSRIALDTTSMFPEAPSAAGPGVYDVSIPVRTEADSEGPDLTLVFRVSYDPQRGVWQPGQLSMDVTNPTVIPRIMQAMRESGAVDG